MPALSASPLIGPLVALLLLILLTKGGRQGRLCVLFLLLTLVIGDSIICKSLKNAIARPRPFEIIAEARVLIGKGGSASMPSSHAANWFAGTCIGYLFYRRSVKYLLPLASAVAFSRVYNGVHYPADVLAGAALGVAYTLAIVAAAQALWNLVGRPLFPLWWEKLPRLTGAFPAEPAREPPAIPLEEHWLRAGYLLIALTLLGRWLFVAYGGLELSEDESYQWLWSKHLDWSYYSKPPLIALLHFAGTHLWGDTEFGVRFFSPLIAAVISALLFRFVAREANARLALLVVALFTVTPMLAGGAVLMTIDSLSVLFWMAALFTGWKAVTKDSTRAWLWTGLWMGLGSLSKYTAWFQWLCWACFFFIWPPARAQGRRPGVYLALAINLLFLLPVVAWNGAHGWITLSHLADRGGLDQPWHFTLAWLSDFLLAELLLLNPIFFLAALWAAVAFWRYYPDDPLRRFLFAMGAPLFIFYALYTLRARVQANWIVPGVLPLFVLMALFWEEPVRRRLLWKRFLAAGLIIGASAVTLLHDTDLLQKAFGRRLPVERDPLTRVHGWSALAETVGAARQRLLTEGPPVFLIGDHYGLTSQLTFYLPEARAALTGRPLVYYRSSETPKNQFYFWPGYRDRRGDNAIFVQQLPYPVLKRDWIWLWLKGEKHLYSQGPRVRRTPPADIAAEFAEVTDEGVKEIRERGRTVRYVQLFACRHLR